MLKNMLEIYNTRNDLKNFHLLVKFKGENAEGDGVAREVYSLFIEQLIFTSCDGRMHFLLVIQPEFGEEEFKIVEKTVSFLHKLFTICSTILPIENTLCHGPISSAPSWISKRDSEICMIHSIT